MYTNCKIEFVFKKLVGFLCTPSNHLSCVCAFFLIYFSYLYNVYQYYEKEISQYTQFSFTRKKEAIVHAHVRAHAHMHTRTHKHTQK